MTCLNLDDCFGCYFYYCFGYRHLYYLLDGLHPENGKRGTLWEAYLPRQEGPAKWPENRKFPRARYLTGAALASTFQALLWNPYLLQSDAARMLGLTE